MSLTRDNGGTSARYPFFVVTDGNLYRGNSRAVRGLDAMSSEPGYRIPTDHKA
jgi:hypothetical protein